MVKEFLKKEVYQIVKADIVNKSGSWFSYNDEKLGQGRDNSKSYLMENLEILNEIEEKVRIHYNLIKTDEEQVEEAQNF